MADDFELGVEDFLRTPAAPPPVAPQLKISMAAAADAKPDYEAELRRASVATGVPLESARSDPAYATAQAKTISMDLDGLSFRAPSTAGFLSDPGNARIAHDDVPMLERVETTLKNLGDLGKASFFAATSGGIGYLQGAAPLFKSLGAPGAEDWNDPKTDMGAWLTAMRQGTKKLSDKFTPQTDNPWAAGVNSGIVSIFQNAPMTAGAVLTKNPSMALGAMGAMTAGQAYGDAKDAGKDEGTAVRYAGVQGAIEMLTEKIPLHALIGDVEKGTGFFKTMAKNLALEAPGEQIATLTQDFNEWVTLHPDKPMSDFVKERGDAAISTLVATVLGSASSTTVAQLGSVASHDGERGAKAVQAQQQGVILQNLDAAAKASKLRARDPQTFEAFVAAATENGPVDKVYIDPRVITEVLAQGDPAGLEGNAALLQSIPSLMPQMDQALATGGDVEIPVSELSAYLSGSELAQALIPHMKTDPLGMSMAESETFLQAHGEELQAQVRQVMANVEATDEFKASGDRVKEAIGQQLATANRFTPDVNNAYAELSAAFYSTMADRLGMTPEEMFAAHPVQIAAAGVASGSLTESAKLDQPTARPVVVDSEGGEHATIGAQLPSRGLVAANLHEDGTVHVGEPNSLHFQLMEEHDEPIADTGFVTPEGRYLSRDEAFAWTREHGNAVRPSENMGETLDAMDYREQVPVAQRYAPDLLAQGKSKEPRGSYNPNTNLITLLKGADLSTFLHESGHFYLETLARVASTPEPVGGIGDDMATALAFMDHKGLTPAEWLALPLDQRREGHELFARSFEAYLMEGKAPSQEVRGLFQRFRSWLSLIYSSVKGLRVELSDDVRGVFDRMLASQQQIDRYTAARGFAPLFKTAEEGGMTQPEWEAYQRLGSDATAEAADQLQARSVRDMKWLSGARDAMVRKLQREAAAKRKAVMAEVTTEVMAEPVNRARQLLKFGTLDGHEVEGPTKLSLAEVKDMYPGNAQYPGGGIDYKALGFGKYGMLAEDGVHPEQIAELVGFGSADEMVRALVTAEPLKDEIQGKTDQRMLERYGDLVDRDAIEKAADEALHNEARLRFVATEANALAKATGGRRVLAEAARGFAADMIGRSKVRDLKPSRYNAAETRAAVAAEKAAKAGDLVTAATEKRNQVINGYAAKATYDAQEEVAKALRYFTRLEGPGARKAMDPDYRDQIDALLERFDLRKGVTLTDIDKRKSLAAWVERQQAMGLDPIIPDELLNEANRKSYKDMTVDELRGLVDSVKNIAHLGRLKNRLLTAKNNRDFQAVVEASAAMIEENATGTVKRAIESNRWVDRAESGVREFFAMHRKFASLINQMGNQKGGGALWEALVRPMNEAGDHEAVMRERSTVALHEILTPIIGERLRAKTFIPEIGASLSLEGRLMVAMNWGNELNRARVMDGDKWTEAQALAVIRTLTPAQLGVVQGVWDHIDSYWPEIAAKERRVSGVVPEKVQASPFVTQAADGTVVEMQGGYFPIKYDPARSTKAESDNIADLIKQSIQGAYTRATTRRGHTKARVDKVERPVRKDFGVIFEHVGQVAHDLAWHEYLIDANRLLGSAGIDGAIRDHYGREVLNTMRKALEDMALGDVPAANVFERGVNHLRTGATVAGLGWNLVTSALQPLGLTQSMVRIGPKWVAKGMSRWVRDAASMQDSVAWVNERSAFMRLRSKTMQREINEVRNQVSASLKPGALTNVEASFFYFITKAQMIADMPTWLGQYEKSMSVGADEDLAVAQADQAVRDSQGAGQIGDLAQIQRGGPLMKLWTNFYSFFNVTYNQLAESAAETRLAGPKRLPLLAADVALLAFVPSVLGTILKNAIKGDDWDDLPEKVGKDLLGYLFGMMVGLRELGGIISSDGRSQAPAGLRFMQSVGQLYAQAEQGEADEAFWKSANSTAGILFHYPAGQVQRTAQGIQAMANGETKNPMVLLVGPSAKK